MDNTASFYLANVGSIPARRTIVLFAFALLVSVVALAKSNPAAPPASEARAVLLFDQKTKTVLEASIYTNACLLPAFQS